MDAKEFCNIHSRHIGAINDNFGITNRLIAGVKITPWAFKHLKTNDNI